MSFRLRVIRNKIPFKKIEFLFVSLFFIWTSGIAQQKLSYPDLANRLSDLEHLAVLPEKGELSGQWSSFDRSSRYDEVSGKYINWEANADGNGYIRMEGDKYVLAEMKGPGVISRIWTALPGEGRILIYLDGSEQPVLNMSLPELAGLWSNKFRNLVYRAGRSLNFFIPIPYQKSCKIVAEQNWGQYYQIGFTTFQQGTILPKFKIEFGLEESTALERVDSLLSQRGHSPQNLRPGEVTEKKKVTINPGETVTIFREEGTRAITSLNVFPDIGRMLTVANLDRNGHVRKPLGVLRELPETSQDKNVLRELVLSIYWDGEKNPSVWSPLGDFFGSAPGWNMYQSLPMGMTRDRFYSFWYMPFEKSAFITVHNDGVKARTLLFEISHAPLTKPIQSYGRFHAKWHNDLFLPDATGRRELDWTLLKTKGQGRYCGMMLQVTNPHGIWWGEGDDKFFVDNEKYPSIAGTGLDSYFGTWGNGYFSESFHAHTITDRSMVQKEYESLNRWHIADNVPFQKSLEISIGKMFSKSDSVSFASTVFWYLASGQQDLYTQVPLEERVRNLTGETKFGVTDCIEGEDMEVISNTGGIVAPQYVEGLQTGGWSGTRGKAHLLWNNFKTGDTLRLALPVVSQGNYKIRIQFIKGDEYGRFKLFLDNHLILDSLNLSHKGLAPSGPIDLGLHKLSQGKHSLMFLVLPSGQLSSNDMQFGLDYLQLEAWDGIRDPRPKAFHVSAGNFTNIYNRINVNDHCFIQGTDGLWHFYGIGGGKGFAHATSETLQNKQWNTQTYPFPVEWNPWKEVLLWAPHIVKDQNIYYMFYCAGSKTGPTFQMHLATSPDLVTWTKHPENPLFIDGFDARDPMVLRIGNKWVMYYCADSKPTGGNHVVAYRLSDDLIHWGKKNIAFVDPGRHKAGGPTESPFVVRRGDTYYLFIGPREGYVGTDIFASKDPFQWHLEDRVGHINSHAAEVVRDVDGKWYISHSGVGEGGLYLAPIFWNDGLDEADSSIPIPGRKN